jgi:hypothetical protein
MKVMLDEIARKKAEADQERLEFERRELERRQVERDLTDTDGAVVRPQAGRVNDSA